MISSSIGLFSQALARPGITAYMVVIDIWPDYRAVSPEA